MVNGNKLNGNRIVEVHNDFLQEQLMDAQQSLFFARSVREAQFLQNKINFLQQRLKQTKLNGNGRKKR